MDVEVACEKCGNMTPVSLPDMPQSPIEGNPGGASKGVEIAKVTFGCRHCGAKNALILSHDADGTTFVRREGNQSIVAQIHRLPGGGAVYAVKDFNGTVEHLYPKAGKAKFYGGGKAVPLYTASMQTERPPVSELEIFVSPGSAPAEEIADLLASISELYRMAGGSGVQFSIDGIRQPAESHV